MRLRRSDKPIVTATGFQDIRINIWSERYGPRPKPVGTVLLVILVVVAIGGLYPAYAWMDDAVKETEELQSDIGEWESKLVMVKAPPEEEALLRDLKEEIAVLKSAREAINEGYGYYADIMNLIDGIIPPASSIDSIRMSTKEVQLQGITDSPDVIFDFAETLGEQEPFTMANVNMVGNPTEAGYAKLRDLKTGSVEMVEPSNFKSVAPATSAKPGSITDTNPIRDTASEQTGAEESQDAGNIKIEPGKRVAVSHQIIKGNLNEPPVTIKLSGSASFHYPISKYKWDFDDGTTREVELQQPGPKELQVEALYTYTTEDSFSPSLTVYDNHGGRVSATEAGIFARADVDFNAEVKNCADPTVIHFKPLIKSSQKISTYMWYFGEESQGGGGIGGDGGLLVSDDETQEEIADSYQKESVYDFKRPGQYSVKLKVIDSLGKPSEIVHNVRASGTPTAEFTPLRVGNDQTFSVRFSDESLPDGESDSEGNPHKIVGWQWDFGDGSPILTGSPNPVHTYASNGPYTVTLTVTESDGNCDSIVKTVRAHDTKYQTFFVDPGGGKLKVTFAAPGESTKDASFLWDFGVVDEDGMPATSTSSNPTFTYEWSGVYHVTLRVIEPVEHTKTEVTSLVSFFDADVEIISANATPFDLVVPLSGSITFENEE